MLSVRCAALFHFNEAICFRKAMTKSQMKITEVLPLPTHKKYLQCFSLCPPPPTPPAFAPPTSLFYCKEIRRSHHCFGCDTQIQPRFLELIGSQWKTWGDCWGRLAKTSLSALCAAVSPGCFWGILFCFICVSCVVQPVVLETACCKWEESVALRKK